MGKGPKSIEPTRGGGNIRKGGGTPVWLASVTTMKGVRRECTKKRRPIKQLEGSIIGRKREKRNREEGRERKTGMSLDIQAGRHTDEEKTGRMEKSASEAEGGSEFNPRHLRKRIYERKTPLFKRKKNNEKGDGGVNSLKAGKPRRTQTPIQMPETYHMGNGDVGGPGGLGKRLG